VDVVVVVVEGLALVPRWKVVFGVSADPTVFPVTLPVMMLGGTGFG